MRREEMYRHSLLTGVLLLLGRHVPDLDVRGRTRQRRQGDARLRLVGGHLWGGQGRQEPALFVLVQGRGGRALRPRLRSELPQRAWNVHPLPGQGLGQEQHDPARGWRRKQDGDRYAHARHGARHPHAGRFQILPARGGWQAHGQHQQVSRRVQPQQPAVDGAAERHGRQALSPRCRRLRSCVQFRVPGPRAGVHQAPDTRDVLHLRPAVPRRRSVGLRGWRARGLRQRGLPTHQLD
mmetsp:Transcript_17758/g.47474  ORF Transcript_17758/g.47474 Transcript_17758/m.47474 type:complete len:237 (-) Transcript_17758:1689-2399(-)